MSKIRAEIGMVFQSFNLFPHLSAIQNVTLGPVQVRGISQKEAEERAMDLLVKVGVSEKASNYPRSALRRSAAARCHCPGACHAAKNHVF